VRVRIRHGGTLKCDARCRASFTSYSVLGIVREQAREAGWSRVPEWQLYGNSADYPRRKMDVCPKHAELAVANANKRDEIMAVAREKRKAERAELRAARRDVRLAERAQVKAARAVQRGIDLLRRKVDRAEQKVRGAKVHVAKARS
jgi:hypothetical protein